MIAVEDLMKLGASRRQIDTIAQELGYPKANEYGDDVKAAVEAHCSKKGKRAKGKTQETAEQAAEQQVADAMQEDLQDVDEGAQRRAAAMAVGRDALTLYYLATGQFTIPELKDAVDSSKTRLKSALRGEVYEPEAFLSLMELGGTNGTMRSLTGSSETSIDSGSSAGTECLPTAESAA